MRLPRLLPLAVALTAVASLSAQQDAAKAVERASLDGVRRQRIRGSAIQYRRAGVPMASATPGLSHRPRRRRSDIVRYDAATGAREILVANTQLIPRRQSKALPIDDYVWSADGTKLLDLYKHAEGLAENTRGDYWVLDLKGGALAELGGQHPPSSLMFAKFSPDATRVGYVRANNVYVERLDDGKITQLTKTDRRRLSTARPIGSTKRSWCSRRLSLEPGREAVAYWQFDSTGVGIFALINNTDSLYPAITQIPYPKAGTRIPRRALALLAPKAGDDWMETPGDPRNTYLARMTGWTIEHSRSSSSIGCRISNDFLPATSRPARCNACSVTSRRLGRVVEDVPWVEGGRRSCG